MVQPPHSKTWLRDAQRIPSHQISFPKPLHHKTFSSLRLTPTRSMIKHFPTFSDKPSLISNVGTRGVTLRNQQVQCFHQTHLMITEAPFKSNTQLLNTNLCLILSKKCESPTHVANAETQLAWQLGPPLATVGDFGGPALVGRYRPPTNERPPPEPTSEAVDTFQPVPRC